MISLLALLAAAAYTAASVFFWQALLCAAPFGKAQHQRGQYALSLAWLAHGISVGGSFYHSLPMRLNWLHSLSLVLWASIGCLLLFTWLKRPSTNLGALIVPPTALATALSTLTPEGFSRVLPSGMAWHILLSILAYALLALATAQAILLAVQLRRLKSRAPESSLRQLAPIDELESNLFLLLTLAFALLTLSLISGFLSLEDMLAQQVVHKTVLTGLSWLILAALLIGRVKIGWRGMLAAKLTLSATGLCVLGYFGSKVIIELVLN